MAEITIRAFEMGDWEEVADLFQAPKCQWGTLQLPFQSRDDIQKKLESPPAKMHRLVAILEGRVVGLLALHLNRGRRAHTSELGMFVHDDFQGQGVGSRLMEAAIDLTENWLNLRRMELTVYTDNAPAIGLYEKHGFVIEGTHSGSAFRDGKYVDTYSMARVKR